MTSRKRSNKVRSKYFSASSAKKNGRNNKSRTSTGLSTKQKKQQQHTQKQQGRNHHPQRGKGSQRNDNNRFHIHNNHNNHKTHNNHNHHNNNHNTNAVKFCERIHFQVFEDIVQNFEICTTRVKCKQQNCGHMHVKSFYNTDDRNDHCHIILNLAMFALTDKQFATLTKTKIIKFMDSEYERSRAQNPTIAKLFVTLNAQSNKLKGHGLVPLLTHMVSKSYVMDKLYLNSNRVCDEALQQLMGPVAQFKVAMTELYLSHNQVTLRGLKYILAAMHEQQSYPKPCNRGYLQYRIQNEVALWLRIEGNQIDCDAAEQYMREHAITYCFADNYDKRHDTLQFLAELEKNRPFYRAPFVCCNARACVADQYIDYYVAALEQCEERFALKSRAKRLKKHVHYRCHSCTPTRLCKRCRTKARAIDAERKEQRQREKVAEQALMADVDTIMNDPKLTMNQKIGKMETLSNVISLEQMQAAKANAGDDNDDNHNNGKNNRSANPKLGDDDIKTEEEDSLLNKLQSSFYNLYLGNADAVTDEEDDDNDNHADNGGTDDANYIAKQNGVWHYNIPLPAGSRIPMVHLPRFHFQEDDDLIDLQAKAAPTADDKKHVSELAMSANILKSLIMGSAAGATANTNVANAANAANDGNGVYEDVKSNDDNDDDSGNRVAAAAAAASNVHRSANDPESKTGGRGTAMRAEHVLAHSTTPLYIMMDTSSIIRTVHLPRSQKVNYWETMLNSETRIDFVFYCIARKQYGSHLHANKTRPRFDVNARRKTFETMLRLRVLPMLKLNLSATEVNRLLTKLVSTRFDNKVTGAQFGTFDVKSEMYKHVLKAAILRHISTHVSSIPKADDCDTVWDMLVLTIMETLQMQFSKIHTVKARQVVYTRKALKHRCIEYATNVGRESNTAFAIQTLIEKCNRQQFGINLKTKRERCMLLLPHTVMLELEYIKNNTSRKVKMDLSSLCRVQQLSGANGLIRSLCNVGGCDLLQYEHGEKRIRGWSKSSMRVKGANDRNILSIAQYYHSQWNWESNLGFLLVTNDRTMYSIACSSAIPTLSLNEFNGFLSTTVEPTWNASFLRNAFFEIGFIPGLVTMKAMHETEETKEPEMGGSSGGSSHELSGSGSGSGSGSDSGQDIEAGVESSRFGSPSNTSPEIQACIRKEEMYATELFEAYATLNEYKLLVKDIFENGNLQPIQQKMYSRKMQQLSNFVQCKQEMWDGMISLMSPTKNANANTNANADTKNNTAESTHEQTLVAVTDTRTEEAHADTTPESQIKRPTLPSCKNIVQSADSDSSESEDSSEEPPPPSQELCRKLAEFSKQHLISNRAHEIEDTKETKADEQTAEREMMYGEEEDDCNLSEEEIQMS